MHSTPISKMLRILAGFVLVGSAIAAGWLARPPSLILILALVFTVSFMIGRWSAWIHAAQTGALTKAVLALPLTYLIQAALVGVLYLIGRGGGALAGRTALASSLTPFDIWAVLTLGLFAALAGIVIALIERSAQKRISAESSDAAPTPGVDDFVLLPTPLTPESFFDGIHFSHGSYDGPNREFNGAANAKSAGDEGKIAAAETRLGVQLPEALKTLYRLQNGGSVKSVCVPNAGVAKPRRFNEIVTPFSGYSAMNPLERLETLHEHITEYADPDDPDEADQFPQGCQQMLVLACWYNETLFLDYCQPGAPRVGFVDFEHLDWEERCVWWNDFEAFFRALRRYQTTSL